MAFLAGLPSSGNFIKVTNSSQVCPNDLFGHYIFMEVSFSNISQSIYQITTPTHQVCLSAWRPHGCLILNMLSTISEGQNIKTDDTNILIRSLSKKKKIQPPSTQDKQGDVNKNTVARDTKGKRFAWRKT